MSAHRDRGEHDKQTGLRLRWAMRTGARGQVTRVWRIIKSAYYNLPTAIASLVPLDSRKSQLRAYRDGWRCCRFTLELVMIAYNIREVRTTSSVRSCKIKLTSVPRVKVRRKRACCSCASHARVCLYERFRLFEGSNTKNA